MTTQEIINKFVTQDSPEHLASNILMGIYLGMEYVDDDPEFSINGYFTDNSNEDLSWIDSDLPENWQFHDNWNFLIPVVQKLIKDTEFILSGLVSGVYEGIITLDYEKMYEEASKSIKIILNKKDEADL